MVDLEERCAQCGVALDFAIDLPNYDQQGRIVCEPCWWDEFNREEEKPMVNAAKRFWARFSPAQQDALVVAAATFAVAVARVFGFDISGLLAGVLDGVSNVVPVV